MLRAVGYAACVVLAVAGIVAADEELPRKGGRLGVRIAAIPDDVRAREKLRAGEGVLVEHVLPETSAAHAGLRAGDLLLTLDGRAIDSVPTFLETVPRMKAGQRVVFGVLRDARRLTMPVTLGPRPPDRGASFDVLYRHVVSKGARIRTIVTRPHAPGRHPALVLIQGLGPSTIDEPLGGRSAYSRILSAFAEAGYVTVRVEKPGIGDSEGGPYADMDLAGELDVYRQALLALGAMEFVDRDHVFVFGHSIGGVFAPLLAAEIPLRGVLVYGTVVKSWAEHVLENTRRQAALGGSKPASIDSTVTALGIVMQDLFIDGKTTNEVARTRPHLRGVVDRFFPDGRMYGRVLRFWIQLHRTDLAAAWTKVDTDVLVMWGRHDFIATEDDHPRIAAIVEKARPGRSTYVAVDGADHGFPRTASVEDSFRRWGTPGADISTTMVTTMKAWTEKVRHAR